MNAKFLFLGTGGSAGVPMVTCKCAVCTSPLKENYRLRPSALIEVGNKRFIIDVGPDFRAQALHYSIDRLDGVFLTHTHYDHIGGLDELRLFFFKQKKRIPILASTETHDELRHRFHYLFKTRQTDGSVDSQFDFQILSAPAGTALFEGLSVDYMSYYQANMKVTGYRFGRLAYISDIREYGEELIGQLKGLDYLILSALRYTPSEVHFNIDEAVAFSKRVGAKETLLTHIAHELEHHETCKALPKGIRLSYDGLEIPFIYE